MAGIMGLIFLISLLFDFNKEDKFIGMWPVTVQGQTEIFLNSSEHVSGKSSGYDVYHLRIIQPKTGEIHYETEIKVDDWDGLYLAFASDSSLWVISDDEWKCLHFPSLEVRFEQEDFYKEILKIHPEYEDIFNVIWRNEDFTVENSRGESFTLSPFEFDPTLDSTTAFFT